MGDPINLKGDEGQLFAQYHTRLRRIVRSQVCAPIDVIDDACADAWLILLRSQPRRDTVFPWLKTVAIHEARRLAMCERRELSTDEIEGCDPAALQTVEALAEFYEELARLEHITTRQRRIVLLHAVGYRYYEIAEITGDSVRTVERQMRRARHRLREGEPGPTA